MVTCGICSVICIHSQVASYMGTTKSPRPMGISIFSAIYPPICYGRFIFWEKSPMYMDSVVKGFCFYNRHHCLYCESLESCLRKLRGVSCSLARNPVTAVRQTCCSCGFVCIFTVILKLSYKVGQPECMGV